MWDYAKHSAAAKACGGPEKFVNQLVEAGKEIGRQQGIQQGRRQMMPFVIAGMAATATAGIFELIRYLQGKKKISNQAFAEAKEELVKGIKEYDASHPDDEASDMKKCLNGDAGDEAKR